MEQHMSRRTLTDEQKAKMREARKTAKRTSRKDKMAAFAAGFDLMRKGYPKIALPLIDRVEQGSMAAAVKLKCLECSCWVRQEVRDCEITDCALYPFRPFQQLSGGNPNDVGAKGPAPLEYPEGHVPWEQLKTLRQQAVDEVRKAKSCITDMQTAQQQPQDGPRAT
jgi:hypothetical protein